jgi:uncharacterized protein (DUF302 family)
MHHARPFENGATMPMRIVVACTTAILAFSLAGCASPANTGLTANPAASAYGVVTVKSAYGFDESVARVKADVAAKGLMMFDEVDQQALAAGANIETRPSTLLVFGNPALGTQFITANPEAGIDWPVRLLVFEDKAGQVWAEYTDFAYIAKRHDIATLDPQFAMAATVIASVTDSVAAK